MNKLGQLKIVGDITPCSQVVRVQNQIITPTPSTVVVKVKPKSGAAFIAGGGTAIWPDQEFGIPSLKKDDTVTVTQTAPGFTDSDPVSAVVIAGPTPAALSNGKFGPLHICAKCIYMYNLFPGTVVEIESNGQPLGKTVVRSTGEAFIDLNRELNGADNLKARVSCGGGAPGTIFASGPPVPPPATLPAPTVEPAVECDQIIVVSGIIAGAQVKVSRGGQPLGPFCCPTGTLFVFPIKGLSKPTDDPITAIQEFPHDLCRSHSSPGNTTIKKRDQIGMPTFIGPICEGDTKVKIKQLRRGATVELTVNGGVIVFGASEPYMEWPVAALTFPQTVAARQNTCGAPNTWSGVGKEVVGSATPVAPKLTTPANGAVKVSTNPMLAWVDMGVFCNRATSFEVQLATNAAFSQNLQKASFPASTNVWFPPTKLKFNTQYLWRVRSIHLSQPASAWTLFKFTTVQQGQTPTPTDNQPGAQTFCFVEDCCPFMRRKIVVTANSFNEAMALAIKQAASNCTITPVDCNDQTAGRPCSQP
jgi:hypothetical protein